MKMRYNISMKNRILNKRLQYLTNQVYKILPIREENKNWQKTLQSVLEEIAGMHRLMEGKFSEIYLPLLSKLEGLYVLTEQTDFPCYRRTIFECLRLMNELREKICLQKQ